jgi:hypothetical protein
MVPTVVSIALSAFVIVSGLLAQAPPVNYLSSACIKVAPGKLQEFRTFVTDYSLKVNTHLVNKGRATSYSLLRAVMPQGEESRCDYIVVTTYTGAPATPLARGEQDKILQSAGVNITWADFVAKRTQLTKLVATELWRTRERVGSIEKGDYMFLNRMRVHNPAEYVKFEQDVWKPVAEQMVKDGNLKAWSFTTLVLPSGTDVQINAVTADVFGSWQAVFAQRPLRESWEKALPNKNIDETMNALSKLRDLARRDLYVVEERVSSQPTAISKK